MAIIPNTEVELVPEVGQVLQGAGGVVDINYAPSYFTESAKINKWSKYNLINIYYTDETLQLIEKIEENNADLDEFCDFSLGLTPYDKYKGMDEYLK